MLLEILAEYDGTLMIVSHDRDFLERLVTRTLVFTGNTEDLFLGQTVEIIGKNMSLDKIANLAGTNGYEILTMLGNRYHKIYKY